MKKLGEYTTKVKAPNLDEEYLLFIYIWRLINTIKISKKSRLFFSLSLKNNLKIFARNYDEKTAGGLAHSMKQNHMTIY